MVNKETVLGANFIVLTCLFFVMFSFNYHRFQMCKVSAAENFRQIGTVCQKVSQSAIKIYSKNQSCLLVGGQFVWHISVHVPINRHTLNLRLELLLFLADQSAFIIRTVKIKNNKFSDHRTTVGISSIDFKFEVIIVINWSWTISAGRVWKKK